jgi:hypothetical protein
LGERHGIFRKFEFLIEKLGDKQKELPTDGSAKTLVFAGKIWKDSAPARRRSKIEDLYLLTSRKILSNDNRLSNDAGNETDKP